MKHGEIERPHLDLDAQDRFQSANRIVTPFTMTTEEAKWALWDAVRYVVRREIPGDFVECGVWKGGSTMLAALAFMQTKRTPKLYLYDTFDGMTEPTPEDTARAERWESGFMKVDLETVMRNVRLTHYSRGLIVPVVGDVAKTLRETRPESICILRLDTDFYESTKAELEYLYPLLSPGGILIVDDYGAWPGCKKAVDDYFGGDVFLSRIDWSVRLLVKP